MICRYYQWLWHKARRQGRSGLTLIVYGIDSSASAFCTAAKNHLLTFVQHGVILCWAWFKLSHSFWTLSFGPHGSQQRIMDKMFWSHRNCICSYPQGRRNGLWCLRADLINHPGKFQKGSARKIYLQYTLWKIKPYLDQAELWLSAQPCCQTAGLAFGAESRKRKYISLEESVQRLTEVRHLVPADQSCLETSLISIPNAGWRAFKKTDLLKMKAHSKAAIQNARGGILPQAEKYGVTENNLCKK